MFIRYSRLRTILFAAVAVAALSGDLGAEPQHRALKPATGSSGFEVYEATIPQIQDALNTGVVTSAELVDRYVARIQTYDQPLPHINAIRDLNPMAGEVAAESDRLRSKGRGGGPVFGIPIILKDNMNTNDEPTTAGSVALEGSIPLDDAFITQQLRNAGAIILAKGNLTEFANYLTNGMPAGYSSLGDFVFNPYDPRPDPRFPDGRPILTPGGSSSGPGAGTAASFAAGAFGTETSGSILSPASANSLVGVKPTVGLVSRTGIIPIASSQDTPGPLARTVTDAAILLGTITAADPDDPATQVPDRVVYDDYTPFLDPNALQGARIGIAFGRNSLGTPAYYYYSMSAPQRAIIDTAADVMRGLGADVSFAEILTANELALFNSSVLRYEFKRDLNAYLSTLPPSANVHSLAEVIAFDNSYPNPDRFRYGQTLAIASQNTDLELERQHYLDDRANDLRLSRDEIDRLMEANGLDALLFGANFGAAIAAKAGYPSVCVPGGYLSTDGSPFGVTFTGRAWSEARLLGLAYAYEQATLLRYPPQSTPPLPR